MKIVCVWNVILVIGVLLWIVVGCSQLHVQDRPKRHYPQMVG